MKDISTHRDEHDPRILIITLNRPAARNAMSATLVEELLSVLEGANDAGAILLHGAGRGFCAGSDLGGLAGMSANGREAFEALSGLLARRIMAHPRPVLAAVHGFAIGGGLTLAAACDIVVTDPDAKWSLPEVPIGLFPAWGLEAVSLRAGRPKARRLAWGIDTLSGEAAFEMGLADMVSENPFAAALALASRLAALPSPQAAAVKEYFAATRESEAADAHANRLFLAACETAEAAACFLKFGSK